MKEYINLDQLTERAIQSSFLGFKEFYKLIRNNRDTSDTGIKAFYDRLRDGQVVGFDKLLEEIDIIKLIDLLSDYPRTQITTMTPGGGYTKKAYVEIAILDKRYKNETWYLRGFHSECLLDSLWKVFEFVLEV